MLEGKHWMKSTALAYKPLIEQDKGLLNRHSVSKCLSENI